MSENDSPQAAQSNPAPAVGKIPGAKKTGLLARIILFFKQVLGQLQKVVWPTKKELWTYFLVVLFFVLAVMVFVGGLDFVFGKLATLVFG